MQCSTCGYLLDYLDKECPRCETLRAKGIDPTTVKNQLAPVAPRICAHCGFDMSGELTSCPQCGYLMNDASVASVKDKIIVENAPAEKTSEILPTKEQWMDLNLKQKILMWCGMAIMALMVMFPPRYSWGNEVTGGSRVDTGLLIVRVLIVLIITVGMMISFREIGKPKR